MTRDNLLNTVSIIKHTVLVDLELILDLWGNSANKVVPSLCRPLSQFEFSADL